MVRLASEIGDGVIINASHPRDIEFAKQNMSIEEKFEIAVCSAFSIDKDREKAVENAKIVVAFIVSGTPEEILERHGIDAESAEKVRIALNEAFTKGNWKDLAKVVTDDMVEAFSISGTPEEVMDRVEELKKLGVNQLIIGSPIGVDKSKAIKLIGKEIIPRFEAERPR